MAAVEHAVMPETVLLSGRTARRRDNMQRVAFLFLAPAAAFLLVLIAYPLCNVLWLSLRYANLVDPSTVGFAGLDNYDTILSDENFAPALWHTFVWTALSVAGEYGLGLVSAIALAQPVRGRAIFRGVVMVPWVIPIAIAGLNWIWLLNPDYGLINAWLVRLGLLAHPRDWLGGVDSALLVVTFVHIWRSFPFYTISLLAALQSIPRELHEAAAMDGAGMIRRFFVITMPHLKAVSLTLIFLHIVWTAINFDFIWVMTQGGPLNSSQTVPVMIYKYAMQDHDVGAACALASMSIGFMAAIFFVYYYGVRRKEA